LTEPRSHFHSRERALEAIDEAIVRIQLDGLPPKYGEDRRTFALDLRETVGTVDGQPTRRVRVAFNPKGHPMDAVPVPMRSRPVVSLSSVQETGSDPRIHGTAFDVHIEQEGRPVSAHLRLHGTVRREWQRFRGQRELVVRVDMSMGVRAPTDPGPFLGGPPPAGAPRELRRRPVLPAPSLDRVPAHVRSDIYDTVARMAESHDRAAARVLVYDSSANGGDSPVFKRIVNP
jgi:hypothetical protein